MKNGFKKAVYPSNGLLISHEKEWSTDRPYNMDDLWKDYVIWKKPDTKDHILYGSIYMKYSELANL